MYQFSISKIKENFTHSASTFEAIDHFAILVRAKNGRAIEGFISLLASFENEFLSSRCVCVCVCEMCYICCTLNKRRGVWRDHTIDRVEIVAWRLFNQKTLYIYMLHRPSKNFMIQSFNVTTTIDYIALGKRIASQPTYKRKADFNRRSVQQTSNFLSATNLSLSVDSRCRDCVLPQSPNFELFSIYILAIDLNLHYRLFIIYILEIALVLLRHSTIPSIIIISIQ